ncbi:MAG TPA: hypothetical protein PLL75_00985 [Candidatus Omnitrophota bacterium]|nr:hypothetical protein [Candidatus Omnitrophota bacterium]HPS36288.1 hypothetical protein [Candidatus Omnitrophota bacterium]
MGKISFGKYVLWGAILLMALFLLTLFLMIITSGPQEGGFIYQIN